MHSLLEFFALLAGTAGPAALLVAATRRWLLPVSWRMGALLFFLACTFVAPAVVTPDLPVPVDEVARGYPYRGVFGEVEPRNPLTNDTAKLFLPWMAVAREELFALRAPLWNRYSFSGYPLLANGESAPFSPFFLATLVVPLPKQIVAMAVLKLFVALLFGWLFLTREGISPAVALFGAAAFAFSTYQTVYLYYSAAAVSALLPAAVVAFVELIRQRTFRWVVFAAVVVASLLAAGHPESVLHVALGTGVVLAIDLWTTSMPRRLWARRFGLALAAAVVGLALAAPAWLPVLEQVGRSARLDEIRIERAMTPPFETGMLWALVNPEAYGSPVRGTWAWLHNYSVVASSFFGLIPLGLAAGTLVARCGRRERAWAIGAVLVFVVSMNWTPLGLAFNSVPPMSLVANDKFRFVAVFLASIAAAGALERIRRGRGKVEAAVTIGVAAVAAHVFVLKNGVAFGWYAAIGLSGAVVFALLALWGRRPLAAVGVALVTLAAEIAVFNFPFNAMVDRKYYAPELPIVEAIRQRAPDEPFRVAGLDWAFLPNASAHYGLEDVRGSDPMAWGRYVDFFRAAGVVDPDFGVLRVVDAARPALDFLNVRFLMTEPGVDAGPGWRRIYSGPDGELFENTEVMPRFFAPGRDGAVRSIWFRRMSPVSWRLTVDAEEPSLIASSVPALPGWRITSAAGELPLRIIHGAFLGFEVPAGTTRVRLRYRPVSYTASVLLFAATVAGLVWFGMRRRR